MCAISCLAQTNYDFLTIAGSPTNGSSDGIGSLAHFSSARGVAADAKYNIYVSDTSNDEVRIITTIQTNWMVTTIAGAAGVTGTNDSATNALSGRLNGNTGIAVNSAGDVFVADTLNNTIRELVPLNSNTWSISTIAGLARVNGTNDNPTNALNGRLFQPWGLACDQSNNVYVADTFNQTIRILSPIGTNWSIGTIAGTFGAVGTNNGTNFSNLSAKFRYPKGIAINSTGLIYVADTTNDTIRTISRSGTNWVVNTVAGLAGFGGSLDGTNGNTRFTDPVGLAVNSLNTLFVADAGNETVRAIVLSGTNYVVTTIGGVAGVTGYNDGTYTNAQFTDLEDLCTDPLGNLFLDGDAIQAGVVTLQQGPNSPPFSEIEVVVNPSTAVTDGGAWTLQNTPYAYGVQTARVPYVLPVTSFPANVVFSNLIAWNSPVSSPIQVASSFCEITTLAYSPAAPWLSISKANGLGITAATNTTYTIQYTFDLRAPWNNWLTTAPLKSGINQIAAWPPPWPIGNPSSKTFFRAVWTGD